MERFIGVKVRRLLLAASGAALVFGALAPVDEAAAAATGITVTKHNLGSTAGNPGVNTFDGTAEICVFCHTPHGANTTVTAPLWNRALPAGPYTVYDTTVSTTIDGKVAAVGSVSIACLSCHDGSQAMNAVINQPGSGGFGGVNTAGAMSGTWSGANQTAGVMNSSTVAMLGTDLSNDHPVGIQYCGGGLLASSATVTGVCRDADFNTASTAVVGGSTRVFWVDTAGGTSAREKTDLILYNRAGFGTDAAGPSVECATCHDPHSSTNPTFLRISNAGSAVCLTCHVK